jgi:hypothetical protein
MKKVGIGSIVELYGFKREVIISPMIFCKSYVAGSLRKSVNVM